MALLIFALIVLIIAGLLLYLVDLIPSQPPLNIIAKVSIIIVAVIVICDRAGFL